MTVGADRWRLLVCPRGACLGHSESNPKIRRDARLGTDGRSQLIEMVARTIGVPRMIVTWASNGSSCAANSCTTQPMLFGRSWQRSKAVASGAWPCVKP